MGGQNIDTIDRSPFEKITEQSQDLLTVTLSGYIRCITSKKVEDVGPTTNPKEKKQSKAVLFGETPSSHAFKT